MTGIDLFAVGELKFPGLRELEKKYLQSINYYVKFTSHSVKEFKEKDEKTVVAKEGERLAALLRKGDHLVRLDRHGKKMDSLQFARFLSRLVSYHAGRVVFMIGGHAGLSPALAAHGGSAISFSDMTFPHDLFRILFLEQLYRALTIIHGVTYHR